MSLKQYRPYVLNLAFGLEVISAYRTWTNLYKSSLKWRDI